MPSFLRCFEPYPSAWIQHKAGALALAKFLKSAPPPDIFKEMIEYLKEQDQEISKRRRIVNMRSESKEEGNSQVSIKNLDPLMFPKTGRKASKRIKSSTE